MQRKKIRIGGMSLKPVFLGAASSERYRTLASQGDPAETLMTLLSDLQHEHMVPISEAGLNFVAVEEETETETKAEAETETKAEAGNDYNGDIQKPQRLIRATINQLGLLRDMGAGKPPIHANVVGQGTTLKDAARDLLANCLEPDRLLAPLFGAGETHLTVGPEPNKYHRGKTERSTKPRPHTVVKFEDEKPPSVPPPSKRPSNRPPPGPGSTK